MKSKLSWMIVFSLLVCGAAHADSIASIGIPGGSRMWAWYSGFGETQWNSRYVFPEYISRNGLWNGSQVVFDMPMDGGSFTLQTGEDRLYADIFGNGIGTLWSFNALAMENDPVFFAAGDLPPQDGLPHEGFTGFEVSVLLLEPAKKVDEPMTGVLFATLAGVLIVLMTFNRMNAPPSL
jgi:hypothetical protein